MNWHLQVSFSIVGFLPSSKRLRTFIRKDIKQVNFQPPASETGKVILKTGFFVFFLLSLTSSGSEESGRFWAARTW